MPLAFVGALALVGCNLDQKGIEPPRGTLNFPYSVELSRAEDGAPPSHIFVINSNFDLRFNQGTLMAFNVDELAGTEARRASTDGTRAPIDGMLADCTADNPCTFTDLAQIESDEVAIGSHADGLALSHSGDRLYIAGRSRQDLSYVDWDIASSMFSCGEDRNVEGGPAVPVCADSFLEVPKDDVAGRDLTLSGDPVAVVTGSLAEVGGTGDGDYVLLGLNQIDTNNMKRASVALYVDGFDPAITTPQLVDIRDGFPPTMITMTTQPGTGITWTTSAITRDLGRAGIIVESDVRKSFIYDAGPVRLGGLDDGQDTRDIAFDPSAPEERAWVLERRPESAVTLDLTRMGLNAGDAALDDIFEVGAGPSRLVAATIGGRTYIIVSCFDAKKVFVIDAVHGALIAVVGGVSGPFEMAVDEARQLLFVTDFSLSVLRIIDLEPLTRSEPPFLLATLGEPTPIPTFAR